MRKLAFPSLALAIAIIAGGHYATMAPAAAQVRAASPLSDLPVHETASSKPGGLMAVYYSSEVGWKDFDKQFAGVLASRGVPVVGIDSLRYFGRPRTAEQVAADLAAVLNTYGERWKSPRAVLIGDSSGAALIPFAFQRLPHTERAHVIQISLLRPQARASFRAETKDGAPASVGSDVLAEIAKIGSIGVQCFHSGDRPESLCRSAVLANAEVVKTDGDPVGIARRILTGAKRRSLGRNQSLPR